MVKVHIVRVATSVEVRGRPTGDVLQPVLCSDVPATARRIRPSDSHPALHSNDEQLGWPLSAMCHPILSTPRLGYLHNEKYAGASDSS